ncbi:hypothetical protein TIFTF001_017438 [Ficus carica]|uniref:Uncharacterized protein n=1 Tax=Ficus carica TaxID=3494 RepID=A0AA88A971_FICCA|nr:hypothetical protein TIFTF001_017438 [Ficus carica]
MRPIKSGLHTVELSRWVSLMSLLEGMVRHVQTILGQLTLASTTITQICAHTVLPQMWLPRLRTRWNVLSLSSWLTSSLTVVMVPLIWKVPFPLIIIPLTSLRPTLISEVSTVLVVVVPRDFTLTKLAFLFLIQMIFRTKGTLNTFSGGGRWSSPVINNHCNIGSEYPDHSSQPFFFIWHHVGTKAC